jgi:chromatin structure-remodeling complex subunit RSC1/2
MEKLSGETGTCPSPFLLRSKLNPGHIARHFDRDPETNEVLWFAAPPLNVARKPAPRHSLQYLHWLATKRKRTDDAESMEVDGEEGAVKGTATERVEKALMEWQWLL